MHLIEQVADTEEPNTALLENGLVVTKTPVEKDMKLYIDWEAISDHTGAKIYYDGKIITPEPGYARMRSHRKKNHAER